ncbi:YlbF family regulator [Lagierella sp.]|uniref:YlbF family regulator n=1 Tax=Lagierella sp. TaxID=2849657 RepID=UPI002621A4C2|nr:YlbF family regulator [Lagierella sp.]
MDLVSKASEIGKELAKDPKFLEYKKLYNSIYKDEKNKEIIDDFRKKVLDYQIKKQEGKATDEDFQNLNQLQNVLSLNPDIGKFLLAENNFSMLLHEVFESIEKEIKL